MHSDIAAGLGASKGSAASSDIIELFPGRERGDIELAEIYARHLLDERDAEIASIRAEIEALRANIRRTLKFHRLPPERRAAIESARQVARNYPEVIYANRVRRRLERARRRAAAYEALAKSAPSEAAYVETTVANILVKLTHCPPGLQDDAMNTAAFKLNRLLAGNWPGLTEPNLKSRFLDACRTLIDRKSPKGDWKQSHYEDKWQHAKRDASSKPNTWPPPTYQGDDRPNGSDHQNGNRGAGHHTSQKSSKDKGELAYGLQIWKEAGALKGTIGEDYFCKARNLDISDEVMEHMRFHPWVKWQALGLMRPAILNAMRKGGYGGEIVSVHATFVGPNGEKPDLEPRKQCFGRYAAPAR